MPPVSPLCVSETANKRALNPLHPESSYAQKENHILDALTLLRDDHRKVKDLFRRFEEARDGTTKKAIVDEAVAELLIHSQIEEEVFYPAMKRAGMRDLAAEFEEEHSQAESIMNELADTTARSSDFEPKFRVLVELVTEHITEEESEMFPRAAEAGRDKLERIGKEMAELKRKLLESSGAKPSRTKSTAGRTNGGNGRNLDKLTKDELYERAQKADISGRSNMNKRELVKALRSNR